VEARQTVRIDPRLTVGGVADIVTVRSGASLINTETPTVGGKVDNRELQQLPFTFRTQNTSPIPAIQAIPEVQRVGQQFSLSGGSSARSSTPRPASTLPTTSRPRTPSTPQPGPIPSSGRTPTRVIRREA
jgi:hypothetical protein